MRGWHILLFSMSIIFGLWTPSIFLLFTHTIYNFWKVIYIIFNHFSWVFIISPSENIYKPTYEIKYFNIKLYVELSTNELLLKLISTQKSQRMVKNMHKILHFAAFPSTAKNTFHQMVCKMYLNIMIINTIVTKTAMTTAEIDPAITPICDGSSVCPVNLPKKII